MLSSAQMGARGAPAATRWNLRPTSRVVDGTPYSHFSQRQKMEIKWERHGLPMMRWTKQSWECAWATWPEIAT